MPRSLFGLALVLIVPFLAPAAPPEGDAFFEKKVRPLLAEHCWSCHGQEKQKGDLRLDSRAAMLAGGDRGSPSIVPGKPEESLLITALRHSEELKMPPRKKLANADIAVFTEWVRLGAPWPDTKTQTGPPVRPGDRAFTAEEKAHWAFQPIRRPPLPSVRDTHWSQTPIDRFVLARLEAAGFKPAPEANKLTLIRRVTFDLTGLPPTPQEIESFLNDPEPNAYAKLVERLLASSAYGEKWGRRWLDVVRYADSNGMDENLAYASAWRYRDYVIRSWNADKPFDQFIREQVAGDLIPGGSETERADRLTATGFLVVGPKMLAEDDPVKMRMDIIDEQLDTLGQAVLGLTLGCARCHDHKFDPIPMSDYYGLAGIFYSTKAMQTYSVVARWHERPIATKTQQDRRAQHIKQEAEIQAKLGKLEPLADRAAAVTSNAAARATPATLRQQLTTLERTRPPLDEVMSVEDEKPQNLRIHLRGNHLTLGAEVPRRLPRILVGDNQQSWDPQRSGRLELAEWLTRPENPLTPRVIANRLWLGHFGAGLVRTPDNFGRLGEKPTHPELLDWLASELVQPTAFPAQHAKPAPWSLKHLHRLIVSSQAYRMSSRYEAVAFQTDPENRTFWRFNRHRLDAEELRDGMLAVSGLLDRSAGGSLLTVNNRAYVTGTGSQSYEGFNSPRRSVYLPVIRSAVYDVLQTLDFPDPSVPAGQRAATTIPAQALLALNSTLADRAAEAFAKSLNARPGEPAQRIREAYQRAYGRLPTPHEIERAETYLRKAELAIDPKLAPEARQLQAWRGLCRVIFASGEFVFVD